jgi:hypothetical protein
MALCSLSALVR